MSSHDRLDRLDPDALAALEEERDFLLRSLDDLEDEYAAGDVDADDYETLKDDYTARAAAVIRAVEEGEARFAAAARPRNPWRAGGIVGAVVVLAVVTGVVMAQASGRRGADDELTGDIRQTLGAQVNECIAGENPAEPVVTLECYDAVLEQQPSNLQALTYRGWFLVRLGLSGGEASQLLELGLENLDEAVATDPEFPDARVFRAVAYQRSGDEAAALAELDAFDELGAPAQAQQLADQLRAEIEGTGSTTSSTSTTETTGG